MSGPASGCYGWEDIIYTIHGSSAFVFLSVLRSCVCLPDCLQLPGGGSTEPSGGECDAIRGGRERYALAIAGPNHRSVGNCQSISFPASPDGVAFAPPFR